MGCGTSHPVALPQTLSRGGSLILSRDTLNASKPEEKASELKRHELLRVGLSICERSLQGLPLGASVRPPRKPNQDAYVIQTNLDDRQDCLLAAVFDGHGPEGEYASAYASRQIAEYLVHASDWGYDTGSASLILSRKIQKELVAGARTVSPDVSSKAKTAKVHAVDSTYSGCTATAAVLDGNLLHVANAGDSRAVKGTLRLMKGSRGRMNPRDQEGVLAVSAEAITLDHKPTVEGERKRIESKGGFIISEAQLMGGAGSHDRLYVVKSLDGHIASRNVAYGVLFTRSLGDSDAHKYIGISAVPDIFTLNLKGPENSRPSQATEPELKREREPADPVVRSLQEHRDSEDVDFCVVLGTDGLWDMVSNNEAIKLVWHAKDAGDAAKQLVRKAAKRWKKAGLGRRDDITAVVILLEWSKRWRRGKDKDHEKKKKSKRSRKALELTQESSDRGSRTHDSFALGSPKTSAGSLEISHTAGEDLADTGQFTLSTGRSLIMQTSAKYRRSSPSEIASSEEGKSMLDNTIDEEEVEEAGDSVASGASGKRFQSAMAKVQAAGEEEDSKTTERRHRKNKKGKPVWSMSAASDGLFDQKSFPDADSGFVAEMMDTNPHLESVSDSDSDSDAAPEVHTFSPDDVEHSVPTNDALRSPSPAKPRAKRSKHSKRHRR